MRVLSHKYLLSGAILAAGFINCEINCQAADRSTTAQYDKQLSHLEDIWRTGSKGDYYREAAGIAAAIRADSANADHYKPAADLLESLLSKRAAQLRLDTNGLWSMNQLASCLLSKHIASVDERRTNARLLSRFLGRVRQETVPHYKPEPVYANVRLPEGVYGFAGMDPEAISDPVGRAKYKASIQKNEDNGIMNERQSFLQSTDREIGKAVINYMVEAFSAGTASPVLLEECMKSARLTDAEKKVVTDRIGRARGKSGK